MTEFVTTADGIDIAYDVLGDGPPIVLIHGFGASHIITWENTSWTETLERAERKIIAIDCRGHGESGKPHSPASYDDERMTSDVVAVLAALNIPAADVMGYSMGAFLAIRLMRDAPGRVRRVVLGGVGETYFQPSPEQMEIIAQGLLAHDISEITDPVAREFRTFCERAGDDLAAMAACMRRPRTVLTRDEMRGLTQPVLVVSGELDPIAGRPQPLADAFAHGSALVIPGRNHHSTVGDNRFKEAVLEFLAR